MAIIDPNVPRPTPTGVNIPSLPNETFDQWFSRIGGYDMMNPVDINIAKKMWAYRQNPELFQRQRVNPGGQIVPPQAGGKMNPQPFQRPVAPTRPTAPVKPVNPAPLPQLGPVYRNSLRNQVLGARASITRPGVPTAPTTATTAPEIPTTPSAPQPWGLRPF